MSSALLLAVALFVTPPDARDLVRSAALDPGRLDLRVADPSRPSLVTGRPGAAPVVTCAGEQVLRTVWMLASTIWVDVGRSGQYGTAVVLGSREQF